MNLFNTFYNNTPQGDRPPKKGVARYLEVFWDHLGQLLLTNVLTFLGFLPAALGISLGIVYGNFWLSLAGGVLGGAVAGPFWTAALSVAFYSFQMPSFPWFSVWRQGIMRNWRPAAVQGGVTGGVLGVLLMIGRFALDATAQGNLPAPPVWMFLCLDFCLLGLAVSLLFPSLCFAPQPFVQRVRDAAAGLMSAPLPLLWSAFALLLWGAFVIGLFPVSVPFAVVIGFWPVTLLCAQLQGPVFLTLYDDLPETERTLPETADRETLSRSQKVEIWWRRHWGPCIAVIAVVSLTLGVLQVIFNIREPDLQVAVVHSQALPDHVKQTLETSFAALAGDRNGDGVAVAQVNDYTVQFDGAAENPTTQTVGVTQLVTDLSGGESLLFVVEDVSGFLDWYGDQVAVEQGVVWGECATLRGMDAGMYSLLEDMQTEYDGQQLLEGSTVFPVIDCPEDVRKWLQ